MRRRDFLGICTTVGGTALLGPATRLPDKARLLIASVQQHMFPVGGVLPDARAYHASEFLEGTVMHPLYDRDIRTFVVEGAEELQRREGQQFLTYGRARREKALRAYERTVYGSGWLDRIMLLSLEGLLSDPIYGGNLQESGWKALGSRGGEPRPVVRYAGK